MKINNNSGKYFLVALLLLVGAALRLTDLFDQPLDFNPTRQLRSAIIARGMFMEGRLDADPTERSAAVSAWQAMEHLEPSILERVSAWIYGITGESIAVPRAINTFLWLLGGLALFAAAVEISGTAGGLTALAYFLFLPFSVYASRSFQPDPGMVAWLAVSSLLLVRWQKQRTWNSALLFGIFGGLAILTKIAAAFFIGSMTAAVALTRKKTNLKDFFRDPQVYLIALLCMAPAAAYYLLGIGDESSGYLANWTVITRWREVLSPSFFMRWLIRVDALLILPLVILGFIGSLIARKEYRPLLWGFWAGYGIYGVFFPHHITTHDYYHLPLVLLTALSLAPLGTTLWHKLAPQSGAVRLTFAAVVVIAILYPAWIARSVLIGQNYGDAGEYWKLVGSEIPTEGKVVGYSQDYGFRLMYYGGRNINVLPEKISTDAFLERYASADYFVVTAKNQMANDLAAYLESYYPVVASGGGYTIFDLQP